MDEDEDDNFDIYDEKIPKNQIANIINKFLNTATPKKKDKTRFSEVIKYRCSLNPQDSIKSELVREKSAENNDFLQIKITSCESSVSTLEPRPKRSIFSQMNNVSKQEFYSINEEDKIKEEEEEHSSQSISIRSSLQKDRISKSSTNNNSFLQTIIKNDESLNLTVKNTLNEDASKLFKIKSMNTKISPNKTSRKLSKSGKKLKLKKKGFAQTFIPNKSKNSFTESKKPVPQVPNNIQINFNQNQLLTPHNLQIPQPNIKNSFPSGHMNYPHQPYPIQPQYNHYPMAPPPMNPNLMPGYPQQPGMPMYHQPPVYMQPMYPNYPNYPMTNMNGPGYMSNQMYPQSRPYYNMPGYVPQMQGSSSLNSIRTQDSSNNVSNGDNKSSEVNSFNK